MKAFFSTLYASLVRGARAVLQIYPENLTQAEMLVGFSGGLVVDFPNSTRAKKYFLTLMVGTSSCMPQARGLNGSDSEDDGPRGEVKVQAREWKHYEKGYTDRPSSNVQGRERKRRKNGKGGSGKAVGKDWVFKKKDQMRKRGYADIPTDTKYTGRKRKHDDVGLKKKIITVGTGWERPAKGDSVTVHYTGTLLSDGSKFDSSRDRDEPFTFTLGQGSVIKGWDVGVATMRKGEKSMLTCKADYAYGAQGSPPKIPANATLCFEVELISWQSVSDICGNGGVIKTTIVDSNGWQKPGDIDECLVTFAIYEHVEQKSSGKEAGPPFGKLIFETGQEGARFCVLEAEAALAKGGKPTILKGIIEAVKTMKKGEVARLTLKPECKLSQSIGGGDAAQMPTALRAMPLTSLSMQLFNRPDAYSSEGNAPDVPADATVDLNLELMPTALEGNAPNFHVRATVNGYIELGNAPDVPPDATVDVHLELVRWNRMEDVSEDGGVVKKTIHEDESNSYNYANEGAKVTVRYTGRLSDGSIFDQHGEGDEFTFTTDEGEVPEGLELVLVMMTK
eukprot:gene10803-16952_t